jgi:hypothetical protein
MRAAAALPEHRGRIKKKVAIRDFAAGVPRGFLFDLFQRREKTAVDRSQSFLLDLPWCSKRAAAARI